MTQSHRPRAGRRTGLLAAAVAASLGLGAVALNAPAAVSAEAAPTAAGATPAPGEVVLDEHFSTPALPAGFTAVEGDWKVEGGRLVGTSANSGQQSRITFGRHLNDFRIEATARFETVQDNARWTAVGLDVPASGATPWSIATMRTGTTAANGLEFAQRTAANAWNVTNTAAAPTAAGTGRDVRVAVEVHGTTARWIFDGKEIMRTTQVARTADGGQALVVNGAKVSFDDLKVTALAPGGWLRPAGSPLTVFAHRGASSAAPENTLVSDEIARRGGAEWIENDVQPSKDGVPYVLHDDNVDRTTNGKGRIRDLTAAQLDALDAGSWFGPAYTGTRVPTLAAQLEDLRTRGGNLLLEIKGKHSRDEVARIVKEVRDHQMTGRVFVQSFEVDALRYTRELAPELPLGLLRSDLDADPVAISRDLGLSAYNPSDGGLAARPGVVKDLHAAGVAVNVWTVDSATRWKALEAAGVDGVITNRPAELTGWNSAWLQGTAPTQPAAPTVAITSPAAGATLDRAQQPVTAVQANGADTVRLTLDGRELAAGTALDTTALALGKHTLRAEATGPGGRAETTAEFTVAATPTGLAALVLTSGADRNAVATLTVMLGQGQYQPLAQWAENQAGRGIAADRARLIAADARALDAAARG
ncbi:glycerophosphodiester phosphodiesterase family protein [Streptomyces sp. CBMA156]|uniref:glycerophosphodiester phosphodiesterase family protein n=1 Tax=Streptomyces sp. CBMA156 TaxID=1930280 RepID=UPI001661B1F9|nr:glycerophosphodiester phosphodiesterase family protein [Streptomyces sp. CBMA156]MBD0671090.1 glycerophosphodiester phosphodiesterase [Streptomyces sp. CBMA156]